MPKVTWDKPAYKPGDTAVVTVDYSDVPDGVLAFTGSYTPSGASAGTPLSVNAPIEAAVTGSVTAGGVARAATRKDDPANNQVSFTVTV